MSAFGSKNGGEAQYNSIQYTPEYTKFISELKEFHTKRGTLSSFDPEPRQGARIIDLLEFYKLVVKHGGYDKVTDKKLHWRDLAVEMKLGSHNPNAQAFQLKSCYYRNLAAYEIKTYWNREPPPKEILEGVTARGGKLLTRTLENYTHKKKGIRDDEDGSDEEGTPARDNPSDEVLENSGRSGRSLRAQPPQRVIFQPDTTPARQTRTLTTTSLPVPTAQPPPRGVSDQYIPLTAEYQSITMTKYEPKAPIAMTLKPVFTPSFDPVQFERRTKQAKALSERVAAVPNIMLPGTGYSGPNIYNRCLMALKSPLVQEQMYALYHLAKISMERGDKYMFEYFPSLPNALIEIGLEITGLYYGVQWEVSYDYETCKNDGMLDGLEGTADILARIRSVTIQMDDDTIQTEQFCEKMLKLNQALLVIRNLVITHDNTLFICRMYELKDLLIIILQLPNFAALVELKHYCLDICEEITKYLALDEDDPLYQTLLQQLHSEDRGIIISSLRAINTISMSLEDQNALRNIPFEIIEKALSWILLDDAELIQVCLDFFYQYAASPSNVDILIDEHSLSSLVSRCCQLLLFGTVEVVEEVVIRPASRKPAPKEPPLIPQDLLDEILSFDEPERSTLWLRCLFEEDKDEFITQIQLWQAYQNQFAQWAADNHPNRPLQPAADFIKNVSTTFAEKANAQVQQVRGEQKFVIRGIRMRETPINLAGIEYTKCKWQVDSHSKGIYRDCGKFLLGRKNLGHHIMVDHLAAKETEDGKYTTGHTLVACLWKGCTKYLQHGDIPATMLIRHIQLHLPSATPIAVRSPGADSRSNSPSSALAGQVRKTPDWLNPEVKASKTFRDSILNKDGYVGSIPINAYYILKTLARQLLRTEAAETLKLNHQKAKELDPGVEYVDLIDRTFKPIMPQLWEMFATNRTMKTQLADLIGTITRSKM